VALWAECADSMVRTQLLLPVRHVLMRALRLIRWPDVVILQPSLSLTSLPTPSTSSRHLARPPR
jgi:hypothetical protein